MRNKYLLITFFSLLSSSVLTVLFVLFYIEGEALKSLDHQLETMASSIFASKLSVGMMNDLDDVDEFMADLLDEQRIDRFIRIFSVKGLKLHYANEAALRVKMPLPSGRRWSTVDIGAGHSIRILELTSERYLLQIAVSMDQLRTNQKIFVRSFFILSFVLLFIVSVISFLSIQALLKPLRSLANDFETLTEQIGFEYSSLDKAIELINERFQHFSKFETKDDIHSLGLKLSLFVKKLSEVLIAWQNQYAQLTHELKTPLANLRNDLVRIEKDLPSMSDKDRMHHSILEIDHLSQTIKEFLQWSHLNAHRSSQEEIFAIKLGSVVLKEVQALSKTHPNRLKFNLIEDVRIFASPSHVNQLVRNIIENALSYSPVETEVLVTLTNNELHVFDKGPGISEAVLKKAGSPFNRGVNSKGSGLGLAWISTLCQTYGWKFYSLNSDNGHLFKVEFQ